MWFFLACWAVAIVALCIGIKFGQASERVMQFDNYLRWKEEEDNEKLSMREMQKAVV